MKTTIDIPLPLLKKAKKYSEEHHITLKALVEVAISQVLSGKANNQKFQLEDKSVSGHGLQSDFDWNDWASIREASYEGRGGHK